MKKSACVVLIAVSGCIGVAIGAAGVYFFSDRWVEFRPVTIQWAGGDPYFADAPMGLGSDEIKRLQEVLQDRHIEYRMFRGKIYLRPTDASDVMLDSIMHSAFDLD